MYDIFLNYYSILEQYYFKDINKNNDDYLIIEMITQLRRYKAFYKQTFNENILNNISNPHLYSKVKKIFTMSDSDFAEYTYSNSITSLLYNSTFGVNIPLI